MPPTSPEGSSLSRSLGGAVLLSGPDDVQRRVDRPWPQAQGDPAPMLLSPDSTRVAVGGLRAVRLAGHRPLARRSADLPTDRRAEVPMTFALR